MKLLKKGETPTYEHVNTLIREIRELRRTAKEKTEMTEKPAGNVADLNAEFERVNGQIARIKGHLDSLESRSRP